MGSQVGIQLIEHDPRLYSDATRLGIEVQHLVQILAHIDHHAIAHSLAAL